ncbi:uncharacterized protein LOC131329594 isoform X3 [Rhododendron vialii]|uniref:uncharacterized protein LOC131329594 isoform X3 n=1 Tax=Rhododendron vialii TaxID=182163 RepID=UPI00265F6216|nr:uncharacterized protein LOC131329594 isoform X3 [Rhododendron vialii]XP_058218796.1 uncharacterized protein LOC131329594 isoform X3 [Rhododendron vialii]XP_058218797.1 uncharacterized protein LOC131329594 isoform X3 [Rhododendron vialii]
MLGATLLFGIGRRANVIPPYLAGCKVRHLMNLRNTCSTETTCQSYDDAYEKPGVTEIAIMEQNAGNQQERIDQTTLKY